jgi:hypothetical protein
MGARAAIDTLNVTDFCHGERGAETTSSMRVTRTRPRADGAVSMGSPIVFVQPFPDNLSQGF